MEVEVTNEGVGTKTSEGIYPGIMLASTCGRPSQPKISFINSVNKTFKITLQPEMLNHGGSDYVCPVVFCKMKIPKNRSIENHIRGHLSSIFREMEGSCGNSDLFDIQYHCPDAVCKYSDVKNHGYFTRVKYLKQHYLKIHALKTLKCGSCQKTFAAQSYLRCHQAMCGKSFVCSCSVTYTTLEALQTHARRKNHSFDIAKYKELLSDEKDRLMNKIAGPPDSKKTESKSEVDDATNSGENTSRKYPLLLPKANSTAAVDVIDLRNPPILHFGNIIYELPVTKTTIDFGTQTVAHHHSSGHSSNGSSVCHSGLSRKTSSDNSEGRLAKRKQSAETQTARVRVRVSTETQTTSVVKRRRTNRKQHSVEAQTQCHRESPPKSSITGKTNAYQPIELAASLKEDSIANPITGFEDDSFFKEMEEVHIQTQTEPDLFLGGESVFSDYDVHVNMNDSDVSSFLNFMTRETQTAHSASQSWFTPVVDTNKTEVDAPVINKCEEQLNGSIKTPVSSSYLETMDNETQTQFYDFGSIFSKMFE